jgi:cob(I)alamin adenosyltransferase
MIYKVADKYPVDERITRFVNRLSDYFFVLARKEVNENGKEVYWEK